jgi:hypothetical protein
MNTADLTEKLKQLLMGCDCNTHKPFEPLFKLEEPEAGE